MKRRKFGMLAGTGMIAAAGGQAASAQSAGAAADPNLLKTTLTPLGGLRAGNADGSIPAWTGGLVSATPGSPAEAPIFVDEQPLVTVDASNMAQHRAFLTEGMMAMMTKFGYRIQVYPTHRTAAAPQYVYANTASNLSTARFDPAGGRLGITGAYGGVPFPIPDMSNPAVTGTQLIWNHLTAWTGFCVTHPLSLNYAATGGVVVMGSGGTTKFKYYYYDPNGSLETFAGYFSKAHFYTHEPAGVDGGEIIEWISLNTQVKPNLIWTLLQGQGRVRQAPNALFDTPEGYSNGLSNADENYGFYGSPEQYDWKFIGKQELYVPYNTNGMKFTQPSELFFPKFPNPEKVRFEKHRVWVFEATLHAGYQNVLPRRRFYADEDTWSILWGDCYNGLNQLEKTEITYLCAVPALPGVIQMGCATFNVQTGGYAPSIILAVPPYGGQTDYNADLSDKLFDAQQMSANASF